MEKKAKLGVKQLRTRHPTFAYRRCQWAFVDATGDATHADLELRYVYSLGPEQTFTHRVILEHVERAHWLRQPPALIERLVFHLGLIEMFSYWKLAASPVITICAGSLTPAQLDWWHELLLAGMGEYFYVNQIDFRAADFVTLSCDVADNLPTPPTALDAYKSHPGRRSLVNLGGGKDSAVMLTMLADSGEDFANFIIAPHSPAATRQATLSGQPTYHAQRIFDPQLRALNEGGYLNGHVPFSASVAFLDLLAAVAYDFDFCLVGNETSADEASLEWQGCPINHQFSKSTKFEQSFQTYCSQYLIKNVKYFSFLRVFNEFQIVQIFCTNPLYWSVTRSCNRSQQTDSWCQACAKCLFVYLLLAVFLPPDTLQKDIFDHDLLADQNLAEVLAQLLGLTPNKPLECVGTRDEARAAFYLVCTKYEQSGQPLPALVSAYRDQILSSRNDWPAAVHNLSTQWSKVHSLPAWALSIAKKYHQLVSANSATLASID